MKHFRAGRLGWRIPSGRLWAAGLLSLVIVFGLEASLLGQDFSEANKSDDPCYKVKQMKRSIMESAEYKKAAGAKDPAYIQCYPLTIFLTWKLTDSIVHQYGRDWITFDLNEEYPAYLMLHYGWFDKLKKKELWKYDIYGPEPCGEPCPGRAKAELGDLDGQAVVCMDYYQNCKPKVIVLDALHFEVSPADKNGQHASFHVGWEGGSTSGRIWSSIMNVKAGYPPKGPGVRLVNSDFWEKNQYQLELNGAGVNSNHLHDLILKSDWTPEEIFEGLRTGMLTKVLTIKATEPSFMHGPAYSLEGTATVKIAFVPVKEERWRVTVKAHEKDTSKPDYVFSDPTGKSLKAAVRADFDVSLAGEFIVRKIKDECTFKEGKVTQAEIVPSFIGLPLDLFQCSVKECAGVEGIPAMMGNNFQGTIEGKKIELTWASGSYTSHAKHTSACVFCQPLKSSMKKVPYKQEFGSGELVYNLNGEVLPLQSGLVVNRKLGDFLTYTISLVKLQ